MAHDLISRLSDTDATFTVAERSIASYILRNRQSVAFENAVTLGKKLGVSSVTIGRFCRHLGYENFRSLKADLKMDIAGVPWLVGPQLEQFAQRGKSGEELRKSLELDLAGIIEVYAMTETPVWDNIVKLLTESPRVHVAGFQTERALAVLLSHFLQYVRPDVYLVDLTAGNYADLLLDDTPDRCVVIVETRRYSKHAVLLAESLAEQKIPTIVLTDKYCDWAMRLTPHVLAVSTESNLFWNSEVSLACAVNLLANSVVAHIGPAAEPRLAEMSRLYQAFTGHAGNPGPDKIKR